MIGKGRPSLPMKCDVPPKRPRIDGDESELEDSVLEDCHESQIVPCIRRTTNGTILPFDGEYQGNIRRYCTDQVNEVQNVRQRVFGNWKFLKQAIFVSTSPSTVLEVLKKRNVITDQYIVNVNTVARPLAFDYILFEVIKDVKDEETFRRFANVIEEINKNMQITWDKHIEPEHETDQNMIKSFKENRRRLEEMLKRDCIIEIKDDFVEKLIFSFDDHQKIHLQLVNNKQPFCFVDIVLQEDKINKGSISCLKNSLQQQAPKYSRIRNFLKELNKIVEYPQPNASRQMTINVEKCTMQRPEEQITHYMTKIEIEDCDEEKVNYALQKGVVKASADIIKTHHSIVEKTEPGCLEIYLKSLDGNITQLITNSLADGRFMTLLKKIIDEEEMKKILLPGKYRLKTKIVSLHGKNYSNSSLSKNEDPNSVEIMKRKLIPANRFFLKREIDTEQLLKAFASKEIILCLDTEFVGNHIEKAEHFLRLIEQKSLVEIFCDVLQEEKMTYVYDRLHTFQEVYTYSDFGSLRKNIFKIFPELMMAVDLDEIKEVFLEREIFTKDEIDEIEQTFEEQPDQAVAQFLVSILTSGSVAMLTFVDALYICGMNGLADNLLKPIEDNSKDTEHIYSSSQEKETRSEKLLFEGIYELIISQTDDISNCEKQKKTHELPKDKSYIETKEYREIQKLEKAVSVHFDDQSGASYFPIREKDLQTKIEREFFYRNSTIILEHGKEALETLLQYNLDSLQLTLDQFLNRHLHQIFHFCFQVDQCCLCKEHRISSERSTSYRRGRFLFDLSSKLTCHDSKNTSAPCCAPLKLGFSIDQLDFVLTKYLLTRFCSMSNPMYVKKAVNTLYGYRNVLLFSYGNFPRLKYEHYLEDLVDIQNAILQISQYCQKDVEMRRKLSEFKSSPLGVTNHYTGMKLIPSTSTSEEFIVIKDKKTNPAQNDSRIMIKT